MAREAYRSIYGDLTKLKDDSVLKDPAAGSGDDDELFELLLAVSDWVDGYCNRHFYPRVETLIFDGPGSDRLLVPDLVAAAEVAGVQGPGGALSRTWEATEYLLLPYNAAPTRPWGRPYGAILDLRRGRGAGEHGDGFPPGQASVRVSGLWGYRCFAEPSGANLATELTAAASTVNVSDGAQFHTGQTLLLGSGDGGKGVLSAEQALVTGISGNELAVTRGLNGTTAAIHASGEAVGILRWPPSVERAALIQAARIWTRAADFEPFYVDADVDTDVRLLLEHYRRVSGT